MPAFAAHVDPDKFVPIEPETSGGVSAWVIVLCVLLGVLFLGGVGYFIYKKKCVGGNSSFQKIP